MKGIPPVLTPFDLEELPATRPGVRLPGARTSGELETMRVAACLVPFSGLR